MKRYLTVILTLFIVLVANAVYTFDPPKGLRWGMTYQKVKNILNELPKDERTQIGKPKEVKEVPKGFMLADLKGIEIFNKKADEAYAIFNETQELTGILQIFTWDNEEKTNNMFESENEGRDQCWEYYQNLIRALRAKYGEANTEFGAENYGRSIGSGVKLETVWIDSLSGDKIIATISRRKMNLIITRLDQYVTALMYASKEYIAAKEDAILQTDDF